MVRMSKPTFAALAIFLGGCLLPGFAPAQQSSAPATQPAPASGAKSAPASKTQKAPDINTGTATTKKDSAPVTLETQKDKVSYAVGINLGRGIHKEAVDVDPEILARGLRDGLSDAKPQMTDEEVQATLTELQKQVTARQQELRQQAIEKNKKAGEAFLASNKDKPGVVVLPSGLQYKILEPGTGPKPAASDSVVCNYRGTLIDGTEFDSSYKRGQPATFPVGQVIKGWTEALQLMPVGSKWQLFIPSDLAYGERGTNGGPVGPNETLIFEVQLVSIQAKPQPAAGAQPQVQRPLAQPNAQGQPQAAPPPPQPKPQAQ
jgi:FKBP-type peptidyl-prolyl cis-trans isomerase FklB